MTYLYTIVIVERNDRLLLVYHETTKSFIAPSGKVNHHESISEGARREVYETTGITIHTLQFRGTTTSFVDDERHLVFCYYSNDCSGEISDANTRWIARNELHTITLPPSFVTLLPLFFTDSVVEQHTNVETIHAPQKKMKRKVADKRGRWARIGKSDYKQWSEGEALVTEMTFHEVHEPLYNQMGSHPICIVAVGYTWRQYYVNTKPYVVTVMYDERGTLLQTYIDIIYRQGLRADGSPWYDDLYLDIIVLPNGDRYILDEDELAEAVENGIISQADANIANVRLHQALHDIEIGYISQLTNVVY